jgi:hypothetical protein
VLKTDSEKIINPKNVAHRMNSFFNDCVENLLIHIKGQTSQMKIKYNLNTMCIYRVIEKKLNDVVCKLKGKSSTAFDQILEFLVKECIQYNRKPFMFIFNVSINQGTFPELMKIEKIR